MEYQIAQVNSTIMNLSQAIWGRKGKKLSCSPSDFIPFGNWDKALDTAEQEKKQEQTVDEMKSILLTAARTMRKNTSLKGSSKKKPPKRDKAKL